MTYINVWTIGCLKGNARMHGFSDLISSWHGISLFQFRILQGCIFFKYPPIQYSQFFQVNGEGFQDITYAWRAKRRERWRKRERGRKKGRGEEKRCAGKGKKYFQRCWGRFSTMLCLETFPSTLKNEGKGRKRERGRKKRERGRKKMHREGKNIFSKMLGKVFNNVMPSNLP